MKIRLMTISLILLVLCSACERTSTEYWPNGRKRSEIPMQDGKYHGLATFWFENGRVQMTCSYRGNELEGVLKSYYPNGKQQAEEPYVAGKLHGMVKTYDKTGSLASLVHYRYGVLHGRYQEFYRDRAPKVEGSYDEGLTDGLWLYYEEGGTIVGQGSFTRGNGVQKVFDARGQIIQLTHYINNVKDGEEIFYDRHGRPMMINTFVQGKLTGKRKPGEDK